MELSQVVPLDGELELELELALKLLWFDLALELEDAWSGKVRDQFVDFLERRTISIVPCVRTFRTTKTELYLFFIPSIVGEKTSFK